MIQHVSKSSSFLRLNSSPLYVYTKFYLSIYGYSYYFYLLDIVNVLLYTWVYSSIQFSLSVVSDSLQPHESQHARPPWPPPTPGIHSDSCPSSQWCHPGISSSVVPFSSCPQSFPASESFPMSQLFAWGGQSIGVSDIKFKVGFDAMWFYVQYASKFGKLSSGHRTGKGQFSFQSQRKAMPKNATSWETAHWGRRSRTTPRFPRHREMRAFVSCMA